MNKKQREAKRKNTQNQLPLAVNFAEQKIKDQGGFRRGEMITFAAFTTNRPLHAQS